MDDQPQVDPPEFEALFLKYPTLRADRDASLAAEPDARDDWNKLLTKLASDGPIKCEYMSWEENVREHEEERRATAEAIRTGAKTHHEIQLENSPIPEGAVITIDWDDLLNRLAEPHDTEDKSADS